MRKKEFAQKFIELFPNKSNLLIKHYETYHELLGHVFFGDEINEPLIELLRANNEVEEIEKYCNFIEEMWAKGIDDVINIVEVTMLERLSDEEIIWRRFGAHISTDFREYINEQVLNKNSMMHSVPRL